MLYHHHHFTTLVVSLVILVGTFSLFFLASLSLFHFSYFSLIYSYSFLFGKPFWFGKKKKQRCLWNFDGHFPIQPSCTLLCFSCIISTRQKRCLSRWERCSYIKMSLSMWVGQSFSKKAWTSGSRRAPTNLSIGSPSRKAITVGKAVT